MAIRRATIPAVVVCFALNVGSLAAAECDRACLATLVTQYLESLVAHSPGALPMSADVKFTEDTVERNPGDGLWRTASKLGPYRLDVLDREKGTAVTYAVLEENGSPILHVARLTIVDRRVSELETMVVRSQADGSGIFDVGRLRHPSDEMLYVPESGRIPSRGEAFAMAERYPAGIRAGSFVTVDAQFDMHAYRLENGRLMAGPGCTFAEGCGDIKTQKIPTYPATYRLIAFDDRLGVAVLRQNFGPRPNNRAVELHTWHAFKIYDGKIHAVEAFMKVAPTGTKSGWD